MLTLGRLVVPCIAAVAAAESLVSAPAKAALPECSGARPGAVLVTPLAPPFDPRPHPTFGFMFEGSDGHLYATTAGHVALGLEGGERTWKDESGIVASDIEGNRVGQFVYAINTRAEARPGLPPGADLALIRVDGKGEIGRAVCGVGGPRGTDDRLIPSPNIVEHRWYGAWVPGGHVGQPIPVHGPSLVPGRWGVSVGMPNRHSVTVLGHASFGDSGAPVLSEDGLAIGWVSGPPTSADETEDIGSFVVSRITPAIEHAGRALGISLTLATAPAGAPATGVAT